MNLLPFDYNLKTSKILEALNEASRLLAELKGFANSIPNQYILINAITINEAKDSSAIVARINRGLNFYAKGVTGFIGVNDLVRCMLSITKQNIVKERFIVVSQCMSFADLLFTIADTLGVKRPKFHVCKSMLFCLKLWYRIKYLFTHRNPRLNDDFISLITDFKLYSNEKSINTIVAGYEPIEQVVKDVCGVYKNAKL